MSCVLNEEIWEKTSKTWEQTAEEIYKDKLQLGITMHFKTITVNLYESGIQNRDESDKEL